MNRKIIIIHLRAAIEAHGRGLSMFPSDNYDVIPPDKEKEILAACEECSRHFKLLREELDTDYKSVYETFRAGGSETDCYIGKNRWCFGLIEFAKTRLAELEEEEKKRKRERELTVDLFSF